MASFRIHPYQALSALLFLYREVLGIQLPWLDELQPPNRPRRIPSVLTKAEVTALLAQMDGEVSSLAKLLYGIGMRLMEGLRLRIKDVGFDRQVLMVRQFKGGKDRVVMLPRSSHEPLQKQVALARFVQQIIGLYALPNTPLRQKHPRKKHHKHKVIRAVNAEKHAYLTNGLLQ